MDTGTRQIVHECLLGSHEDTMKFPDVVRRLSAAGVERYRADLCRGVVTYYSPDGSSHDEALKLRSKVIAGNFSADGVVASLRAVQGGAIDYDEFLDRAMAAGCVSYSVFLAGRKVVYVGRRGEEYVESFPPSL